MSLHLDQFIVTVQIQSREKDFKGAKIATAKWTSIEEPSRIYTILLAARSNEKGRLQVLGGGALSSAQCVTLQKYFSHPSFTYLLIFCNPTQQTKTGTAKFQIGGRLLVASICTNHNREHQSYHVYYTLLQQVLSFDVLSTNLNKLCKSAGPNRFC
jgi:hypothetical protein